MNKVVVRIQGSEYNIVSKKNPENMKEVARYVDDEMNKVREGNPKLNSVTRSIVACLNIADVLFDCSDAYEKLEEEVKVIKDNANEPNEEMKEELSKVSATLEQKELDIIDREYKIDELNKIVDTQQKGIENLNRATEELRIQIEKYKEEISKINEELLESSERAKTAEYMSSQWQNKAYDVQLKYAELEGLLKNREGAL